MFDFDAALDERPQPPLPHADRSLDEIRALDGFTRLVDGWAAWLLELRRLLADDGRLVVGLAPRERFEELTGSAWDESRIGMTVLSALDGAGHPLAFHSEWWVRAHWGRAFEITALEEADGRLLVHLKRSEGELAPADLERAEPGDERELAAAQANVSYLADQLERAAHRHLLELEELREDLGRELMRRAFTEADLEWARRGPGSPAMLVAAEYEATTSWRITRPMRALGQKLRRLR